VVELFLAESMDSWSFLSVSPPYWFCGCRSGRGEEPSGESPPA